MLRTCKLDGTVGAWNTASELYPEGIMIRFEISVRSRADARSTGKARVENWAKLK